eukprot:115756_1
MAQAQQEKKSQITVRKNEKQGKYSAWPIWSKEVSKFDWSYDSTETCFILEGEVTVTPTNGGDKVSFGAGDVVVFHKGLECVWNIKKAVKKHYNFE